MKPRVLAGCEYSGRVRDAFTALGWDAWSCDLLPSDVPGQHYQGDIFDMLEQHWDLGIFFPPCTYLCSSGMHWTVRGLRDPQLTEDALEFVHLLMSADIEHIAVENPVGSISSRIRKPDQIIHPWQFGHGEQKKTCLWLKNLPLLIPTNVVPGREQKVWKMPPSSDRWKQRSITYQGVANAIASQWSEHIRNNP